MTRSRSPSMLSSRVIGRSSQSGPLQGVVTLGTIGQMALFFSSLKCQHYYDSGQPSGPDAGRQGRGGAAGRDGGASEGSGISPGPRRGGNGLGRLQKLPLVIRAVTAPRGLPAGWTERGALADQLFLHLGERHLAGRSAGARGDGRADAGR